MSKLTAAVALLAATASVASAEPNTSVDDDKNPALATALSLGGTAASFGLIALGASMDERAGGGAVVLTGVLSLAVTPAIGEFYAGKYLTAGMGMRVAGGALVVAGFAEGLSHLCFGGFDNGPSSSSCDDSRNGPDVPALALISLGAASVIGGTIYDIATAGRTAEQYNNRHHLAFAPTVIPSQSGPTTGFAVSGTF